MISRIAFLAPFGTFVMSAVLTATWLAGNPISEARAFCSGVIDVLIGGEAAVLIMSRRQDRCSFGNRAHQIEFAIPFAEMIIDGSFDREALLPRIQAQTDQAIAASGGVDRALADARAFCSGVIDVLIGGEAAGLIMSRRQDRCSFWNRAHQIEFAIAEMIIGGRFDKEKLLGEIQTQLNNLHG